MSVTTSGWKPYTGQSQLFWAAPAMARTVDG
jgi:hypothetical protein